MDVNVHVRVYVHVHVIVCTNSPTMGGELEGSKVDGVDEEGGLVVGGKVNILFTGLQSVSEVLSNSRSYAVTSYSPSGRRYMTLGASVGLCSSDLIIVMFLVIGPFLKITIHPSALVPLANTHVTSMSPNPSCSKVYM